MLFATKFPSQAQTEFQEQYSTKRESDTFFEKSINNNLMKGEIQFMLYFINAISLQPSRHVPFQLQLMQNTYTSL